MVGRIWSVLGLAALVAVALASTSAGQPSGPGAGPGSPPGLDKALAAKEKHADRMLDKPGVVGIGVGLNKAGKPVIRIYKDKSEPADVPDELESVPTEQVTTGTLVARSHAPNHIFPRPVPIGVSAGHLDTATGTLGARVSNGSNVFALSNNHVFAFVNQASIGDGIIQPGNVDGGNDPADRIGTLHDFQTINFNDGTTNTIDAAIALTSTGNVGTATPADGYGTPSPVTTEAFVGQAVQKYGRTTGFQLGTVVETNVTVDVCYIYFPPICLEDARFVNQISITPEAFSAGGDSGSLIVTQGGNQPVALLFAGGEGRTIGNPIDLVLQRFGVTIDGSPPPEGPPGAPTALTALAGDESAALSWAAPAFDGGSPITNYKVYRGTSAGGETFHANAGATTSYTDATAANGTTYYYKVSAENANGEGALSNGASATPSDLVLPSEPLATVDDFDRANESPLSDQGRWTNGVNNPTGVETGLHVSSGTLACSKTTTCTAWRNAAQYGPDVEVWARVATLLGVNNHIRLYARLQQVGTTAYDGYMLRTNQLAGTDQVFLERIDNGSFVNRLTVARELAAGDRLLLRAQGSTLELWHHDGSAWSRIGVVSDSTYTGIGFAGIGLRGTVGRLDDFGARGLSQLAPGAPTALTALAGDESAALSWAAPAFDGGSPITNYKVYRGTSAGGETFHANAGATTSYTDATAANGTTYYYKVSAENANGEGALSNGASATPSDLVLPSEPLATVDDFDRANESPLSDQGRWTNGVNNPTGVETGLHVSSGTLACSKTTTCTAWRNAAQYGPDVEVWARVATLLGVNNHIRLYARLQQVGTTAYDGYMLRTNQLAGTDQVFLERIDNGSFVNRLTVARELAAGDRLLLRAQGSTLELWHHDGSAWSRIGVVSDSTYTGIGFAGIGLRGTVGRLDDFGARTPGAATAPAAPQNLQASGGNAQVALAWSAPSSTGGSAITGYFVYRGTSAGGGTFLASAGTSTSYTDATAVNGTTYHYTVSASNAVGEGPLSNEASATPAAPTSAPTAPQNLQASGGNAQVALAWSAPSSTGGSAITGYFVYRGTSAGGGTFLASAGTSTSYTDATAVNGTTYHYTVSASNAVGEGPLSNEASATPTDLVPPVEPLPVRDTFNRANENPLSFGGRWGRGILGAPERSLRVISNQLASDRNTTATAWWNPAQFGPDSEAYATIATLPGNGNSFRLYVRLQSPGSAAVDGYMLLYTQASGADQFAIHRLTNGGPTALASASRDAVVGNRLLLRARGSTLEAWLKEGAVWTRVVRVDDATYPSAGFVGVGIRDKTGRLDDFGGR